MRPGLRRLAATILVAVSVAMLGGGCGPGAPEQAGDQSGAGEAPEDSRTRGADRESERPRAREVEGFVAAAESSGGTAGAADRIRGVEFKVFEGYERVLISFGGGNASGVPVWSLESPPEGGYVRVRFPGVASTALSDKDLVGLIMDRLYVVGDPEDGLFVDVFSVSSFRYRVTELPDTGRLAVDFRPAEDELRFPPATSENAVVVQPREAEAVESPLTVEGYSSLPDGRTNVSLIGRDGEVISSKMVRAGDRAVAWDSYEATLGFSGYEGIARLRVGGESPRGTPRGVTFEGADTEVIVE